MSQGILAILRDLKLDCLSSEAFNLDYERFSEPRDAEEHVVDEPFESPKLATGVRHLSEVPSDIPSILRFFLDGSRRTYKVADVIVNGRFFYPIVAGQVGVAVVERDPDGRIKPLRQFCSMRNVLAFPDKINKDDLLAIQATLAAKNSTKFDVLDYTVKDDRDLTDLAVAKIMSEMHTEEVRVVQQMVAQDRLWDDAMLVVDGPLRFKKRFELPQFRNVVGVSKSFRPTFTVGKGLRKESVGNIVKYLKFGSRTSVFRSEDDGKILGVWYLRIRPPEKMLNPLQGVLKLERYAIEPEEQQYGLDADRIDTISMHLLRDRNVTPFKADPRWAGHLYPVYMAETFLKRSFLGDAHFLALFRN